jgi:RNA polymerase sigma-70 factor (ECF subfamily)
LEVVHNQHKREPDIFSQLNTEEITRIIDQLPPGYKIVFNMYAIEGFSHKEISEHLQIAESASRSQLSRAKKMLQDMIIQHKMFKVC